MKLTNAYVISLLTEDFSLKEITDWINHKQQSTLRDEFAMAAMQAILNGRVARGEGMLEGQVSNLAFTSYVIADAMLAEKNSNISS